MSLGDVALSSIEIYTLLAMIYVARKTWSRGVRVKDLARVLGRSDGRVRAILGELKEKGYVEDVGRSLKGSEIQSFISDTLARIRFGPPTLGSGGAQKIDANSVSKGAPEKIWRLKGYDPLNDNAVEKFFKDFGEAIATAFGLSQEELQKLKEALLSLGRP